jgi:hypothetical protein
MRWGMMRSFRRVIIFICSALVLSPSLILSSSLIFYTTLFVKPSLVLSTTGLG